MRLSACQIIFCLIFVFACGCANAGSIAKRDAESPSILSQTIDLVINIVTSIPLIGGPIAGLLQWIVNAVNLFEIGTNHAIARLLGGALPCNVTLQGTYCSGVSRNGGFGVLLMHVIDGIPSLVLPDFIKSLIGLLVQAFIDPTVDVIFGGIPVVS